MDPRTSAHGTEPSPEVATATPRSASTDAPASSPAPPGSPGPSPVPSPVPDPSTPFGYHHITLAVDNSPHSNRGIEIALDLATRLGARVTATHAYAASLHDLRFRQMEGGLPERYRKEDELERQREVHDTLITKGLEIITDSYLDVVDRRAGERGLEVARKQLEGKNYRALLDDIAASDYDLVILGALGLGVVPTSVIGSVCERVVRGTDRDVLVVKDAEPDLAAGPVVVAVDGSDRSYAALKTAVLLAKRLDVELEVVSAFDPFFHYVAFNNIAQVLSDEAGQVFRFQEQEKLHEEIIDSGLAKIYQGHLAVAAKEAAEDGIEPTTTLLAGKPYQVILEHVRDRGASLLVLGRTGVHADPGLGLGNNTENLLRLSPCNVLITGREFRPDIEKIVEETTSWTEEAEARMERVPSAVQRMARMAILRYAQENGHTVVSERIVDEAVSNLLPPGAREAMGMIARAHGGDDSEAGAGAGQGGTELAAEHGAGGDGAGAGGSDTSPEGASTRTFDDRVLYWADDASSALQAVDDPSLRETVRLRAEKLARRERRDTVSAEMVRRVSGSPEDGGPEPSPACPIRDVAPPSGGTGEPAAAPPWESAALERIARVPEGFMRDRSRQRVEAYAREQGEAVVTLAVCEAGLAVARKAMMEAMSGDTGSGPAPSPADATEEGPPLDWTADAEARMERVPAGFMRDLTRWRIEGFARRLGAERVTAEVVDRKYAEWQEGSAKHGPTMPWAEEPLRRIERIPDFVRGMVVKEVERCARASGETTVTVVALETAMRSWNRHRGFHSENDPELYSDG